MIEIRGEGFYNGTIESEDKDQVTFQDADGRVRTLAKKDILFMERQAEASPAQKTIQRVTQTPKKVTPVKSSAASSSGGGATTGGLSAIAKAKESIRESNARVEQALREGDSERAAKKDSGKGYFSTLS